MGKQLGKALVPHIIVGDGEAYAVPDKSKGPQDDVNDEGQSMRANESTKDEDVSEKYFQLEDVGKQLGKAVVPHIEKLYRNHAFTITSYVAKPMIV